MSRAKVDVSDERLACYIGTALYRQWPLNNGNRTYANIAKDIGLESHDIIKIIGTEAGVYIRKYLLSDSASITQYDKNYALDLYISSLYPLTVQQITEGLLECNCNDKGKLVIAIIKYQLHHYSTGISDEWNCESIEDPHKELEEDNSLIGEGSLSLSKMNAAAAAAEWD